MASIFLLNRGTWNDDREKFQHVMLNVLDFSTEYKISCALDDQKFHSFSITKCWGPLFYQIS